MKKIDNFWKTKKLFFDEKKQHKFLKALENLALKTYIIDDNKNEINDKETSMSNLLQYGSTISRHFAMTYIIKKKFVEAHENGDIYIHNLDFLPMGTTNCFHINIDKLYKEGFYVGNTFIREPNDITNSIK